MMNRCLCGANKAYEKCCEPFITGAKMPLTAEALMRSRFVAYATNQMAYVRSTWHPNTCPDSLVPDGSIRWVKLTIVSTKLGKAKDKKGMVTFKASFDYGPLSQEKPQIMTEKSHFVKDDLGRWLYVDGVVS